MATVFQQLNDYPKAENHYSYILVKQGHPAEGLTVLEKAASLAPIANNIQFHLAEVYVANNRDKAIKILETLAKSGQDFSDKKSCS